MKKLILLSMPILLSALLITGNLNAQKNMAKASVANPENISASPSVAGNELADGSPGFSLKDVNTRAIKDFNRNYKEAAHVTWSRSGKATVAYFKEDDRQIRVIYLPDGSRLHTLITYQESELPDDVKTRVKNKFRKYSITQITEIHERDKVFYFINIEKDKNFKQLIAYQDEVWVHKQFYNQ